MEIFHLEAEERRWCSNLMHSDLHLLCKDGKVSAHSARLVDLSVYLFNLLEQSRGCSNCKEPTVLQLPDFYLADCQALIELIYKGGTTLTKTKVERVVALSRTLGIKLTNVFGDVAKSSTPLRFPIHGFQGDEMEKRKSQGNYVVIPTKSSHQHGSPTVPKTSLQTKPIRTGLGSRSAVSSQALRVANFAGLQNNANINNKPALKISSSLKLDPTSKRVIRVNKSQLRVVPLVQERIISRKRAAGDSIEIVDDARQIKTAKVLNVTKDKKQTVDAIKEELSASSASEDSAIKDILTPEIMGKEDKTIRSTKDYLKVKKMNTRTTKKSSTSPLQPLSASSTRRAKQAPITQSKPGSSSTQSATTEIKTEPASQQATKISVQGGQKRIGTSVILSDRGSAGKNLIAEIATSEVEDKILAEIEEKLSLPLLAKVLHTPDKRPITAEAKILEKKDGSMKKCWFCDRECKEIAVHVALHHFREQILRKTVGGKCLECGYKASDNEVILHIAFEHMAFKTNKKSFTPMFLASKGLVVEISEKEISKPDLPKPESIVQKGAEQKRSQEDKLSKVQEQVNKSTQKAKEQKPKPAVKEVFIVKKKDKTDKEVEKNVATVNTNIASKGLTRKGVISSSKARDVASVNRQKIAETTARKERGVHVHGSKGCGSCVKCKLPDCGSCVFCQNKNTNGGGKGLLMKVCVKKVCRNRTNAL